MPDSSKIGTLFVTFQITTTFEVQLSHFLPTTAAQHQTFLKVQSVPNEANP